MVLNPFFGCGTTIDAAEKLALKWVGFDLTPEADRYQSELGV